LYTVELEVERGFWFETIDAVMDDDDTEEADDKTQLQQRITQSDDRREMKSCFR